MLKQLYTTAVQDADGVRVGRKGYRMRYDEVPEQMEKAIRQAVGEEMLELKPGVVLAESLASDGEWAEYEGYNKALDDWEQKIKQWSTHE